MVLKRRNYMWRGSPRSDGRRQALGGRRGALPQRGPRRTQPPSRSQCRGQCGFSATRPSHRNAAPHHAAMSIRLRRHVYQAPPHVYQAPPPLARGGGNGVQLFQRDHRTLDRLFTARTADGTPPFRSRDIPARRCSANSADWTRLGFIAQRSDRGLRPGGLALRALPHSGARGPTVRYLRVGSAMMC